MNTCSLSSAIALLPASTAACISATCRAQVLQFHAQVVAHGVEAHARIVRVEEIGRLDQLGRRVRQVGLDDAVLHVAFRADDDQQDALVRQPHEFHLPERLRAPWRHHHAGEMRQVRQRMRRRRDHALRPELLVGHLALDLAGQLGQLGTELRRAPAGAPSASCRRTAGTRAAWECGRPTYAGWR
jgi:hypothetical protein